MMHIAPKAYVAPRPSLWRRLTFGLVSAVTLGALVFFALTGDDADQGSSTYGVLGAVIALVLAIPPIAFIARRYPGKLPLPVLAGTAAVVTSVVSAAIFIGSAYDEATQLPRAKAELDQGQCLSGPMVLADGPRGQIRALPADSIKQLTIFNDRVRVDRRA